MKKIKISSVLSNSNDETLNINTTSMYDEKNKIISYMEKDLNVKISILDNKLIIERYNDDYDLKLEFEEGKSNNCKYNVKSIGLEIEVCVYTKLLEISNNIIHVLYELFNDNNSIGVFEYKLILGSDNK